MQNLHRRTFATRAFRDVADMDYIAARVLYRNDCFDQFLIFSQQCIEKYLKAMLLYNSVKFTKPTHNLEVLLKECEKVKHFKISDRTKKFIEKINGFDELRYGIYVFGAFSAERRYLIELDYAVMDIRRYCHSDRKFARALSNIGEDKLIKITKRGMLSITALLEKIQKDKDKKSKKLRSNLIWKNFFFSPKIKKIKFTSGWWGKASGFTPKELKKSYRAVKNYVYIPKNVREYFEEEN